MAGLTLDSGALIGYERSNRSVVVQIKAALQSGIDVTVPAVVLGTPGAGTVDALVMASAATRGDTVLTSDLQDLSQLRAVFTSVKVVRI